MFEILLVIITFIIILVLFILAVWTSILRFKETGLKGAGLGFIILASPFLLIYRLYQYILEKYFSHPKNKYGLSKIEEKYSAILNSENESYEFTQEVFSSLLNETAYRLNRKAS